MTMFSVFFQFGGSMKYDNVTEEPAFRQLYEFKQKHSKPIGLMTISSGGPVEIRDTVQLNSDQFSSEYQLDLNTHFDAERIPERVVHAKGAGAFGYIVVTNDVAKYTNAEVFNGIGKKTPLFVRFSTAIESLGGSDLRSELKGMAIKYYTNEGNLDLLCLQTPVYLYRNPVNFSAMVHTFKPNPRTGLRDPTAIWDFLTLRPDLLHTFFWTESDYGIPNGYRKMDAFPIHTYEISNNRGDRQYVRFNFRTEQGIENLTPTQAATIQGTDLHYYIRDLYNAIEKKEFPSWRVEMDIMRLSDLKMVNYNPFDVTRLWKNGTYVTVQIGRLVLDRNPDNFFKSVDLSAFNPGNLIPGIPGPVDFLYKARRVFYRDAQNYRLGRNHNKIDVNLPKHAKTYNRDGVPPAGDNMEDVPNYYPNSFNGPMPYVDETRPEEKLLVLERHAVDLEPVAYFYNHILKNDAERQRLIEKMVSSLVFVNPPIRKRVLKFMYLIDRGLGKRMEVALEAAILAAKAKESG